MALIFIRQLTDAALAGNSTRNPASRNPKPFLTFAHFTNSLPQHMARPGKNDKNDKSATTTTPLMTQYNAVKAKYPDAILL